LIRIPSLPIGTPAALAVLALSGAASANPQSAPSTERFLVRLDHDVQARAAGLADLAAWRRAGDELAFRERVALLESQFDAIEERAEAALLDLGFEVVGRLRSEPALIVSAGTGTDADLLAQVPGVASITRDELRAPALAGAIAAHGIPSIHAQSIGGVPLEGNGVTVAVLDTGIDLDMNGTGRPHAAFFPDGDVNASGAGLGGSRILSAEGFSLGLVGCSDPEDTFGHGTRIASIAAGAKWNGLSNSSVGAAPGASIRSYRVSDCLTTNASTITMEVALDAALLEPDVRVVNLSYDGTAAPDYDLNRAMDDAVAAGVSVVVSAGNFGPTQTFMHGAYDVITAGASFVQSKEPYVFPGFITSAVGPLPDGRTYPHLLAVGEQISAADIDNEFGAIDSYGTSGAAALVSGTAALLYQAVPTLEPLEVKALILEYAADLDGGDPDAGGYGFLDSAAAFDAATAGLYSSGVMSNGQEARWGVYATAGQELSFTLVTTRALASAATDFDLWLVDPAGGVVAFTAEARDNVDRLEAIAPMSGSYTLIARPRATYGPTVNRRFAIAGVGGVPAIVPDSTLGQAGPSIEATSDVVQSQFYVKGLGLDQTTSVTVGGVAASFTYQVPSRLRIDVPAGVVGNALPVIVSGPSAIDATFVSVDGGGPKLDMPFVNFTSTLNWTLEADAGQPYWIGVSTIPTATVVPGLVDLAIGAGGTNLFLVGSGTVPASGVAPGELNGLEGLPNGTQLYFQGVVLDVVNTVFEASNVDMGLKAIHFG
jgi:hypothetical protein